MKCIVKTMQLGGHTVLAPNSEIDQETFAKLRLNTSYKADLRKARNPDHHRKGFALINLIFDSQERYNSIDDLLIELKLQTGWYSHHVRENGDVVYIPKSISFADMDQLEFEEFYDRLVDIAKDNYHLAEAMEFI